MNLLLQISILLASHHFSTNLLTTLLFINMPSLICTNQSLDVKCHILCGKRIKCFTDGWMLPSNYFFSDLSYVGPVFFFLSDYPLSSISMFRCHHYQEIKSVIRFIISNIAFQILTQKRTEIHCLEGLKKTHLLSIYRPTNILYFLTVYIKCPLRQAQPISSIFP